MLIELEKKSPGMNKYKRAVIEIAVIAMFLVFFFIGITFWQTGLAG
jgi:hypothetical protein